MSEKMNTKIKCPVCGKMISENLGRKVHEKSKFHQDALKKQEGELKDDKDTASYKAVKDHKEEIKEKENMANKKTPTSGIKDVKEEVKEQKDGSEEKPKGKSFLDSFDEWYE